MSSVSSLSEQPRQSPRPQSSRSQMSKLKQMTAMMAAMQAGLIYALHREAPRRRAQSQWPQSGGQAGRQDASDPPRAPQDAEPHEAHRGIISYGSGGQAGQIHLSLRNGGKFLSQRRNESMVLRSLENGRRRDMTKIPKAPPLQLGSSICSASSGVQYLSDIETWIE